MKYEWQTYGFAWVGSSKVGWKLVNFKGTPAEAQRQLDDAAKEFGGKAPNLSDANSHKSWDIHQQVMARRLFS